MHWPVIGYNCPLATILLSRVARLFWSTTPNLVQLKRASCKRNFSLNYNSHKHEWHLTTNSVTYDKGKNLAYLIFNDCCTLLFPGVQSAAVNVICELARKNPKNYLSLAPLFFKLMTSSTNNWMLIKIIKLVSKKVKSTMWVSPFLLSSDKNLGNKVDILRDPEVCNPLVFSCY